MQSGIISAAEAFKRKDTIKFVDATYSIPGTNTDPKAAYLSDRIENAVFFDIDDIADPSRPGQHFMPDTTLFAQKVGDLGLANDDTIVIYDRTGVFLAAARAWWMFKTMGHNDVLVLDGGLPQWCAAEYPLNSDAPATIDPVTYEATMQDHFADMSDVLIALENTSTCIVDARAEGRFNGDVPEPRPGMRAGHIPGSTNIPFQSLLDEETGLFKPAEELRDIFKSFHDADNVISSCGSGVTACVLPLAATIAGYEGPIRVYDGSWSEWGDENSPTPVASHQQP
jgi:thiosulfate/3-mercaptopyruvate sulfurtransferase